MQEQIRLKTTKSGTTVTFFNTHLPSDGVVTYPGYVLFNQNNQPIHVETYEVTPMWRDLDNALVPVSSLGLPYIVGSIRYEDVPYTLKENQRQKIADKWSYGMDVMFSGLCTSHVFFKDVLLDDMFINIDLHRTYGTLDTLNVYNNMVNSFPVQESDTGTVFGRLVALQKILDADGNNVSIPLRNVPIGIFNPTEAFPSPVSTDQNGNRITLNLVESSNAQSYFNIQSYTADTTNYLKSGSEFTSVPPVYKYVTTTNEEGEFVIHNAPVGTQVLFFEVDLFKQGLTQDEIALNFFPFPADDVPNISRLPSLFFRQFPIDVIPTWGTVQTGYTETNISVELDLRKWATFFVEQISFNELDLEALQSKGFISPLTIDIRNMAKNGFPKSKIQIVEIPEMISRDQDHVLLWDNEFPQLKSKAQFYTGGYHAFKLPANMYDPVGMKTDQNGFPTSSKGVWLAGYQMSMYYSEPDRMFRNTGSSKYVLNGGSYVTRDHFNLNQNNSDLTIQNSSAEGGAGFPYEKRWDHVYPERYSIPHIPVVPNPDFNVMNAQGKRWIERPRFLDGDMVGKPSHRFLDSNNPYGGTGGYGVAVDDTNNEWFKTDFSKVVTKNYIYKYENTSDPNSRYACGYMPNNANFPLQAGSSFVALGEKYQRVECGYGYWLKPEGWPRIAHYTDNNGSEAMFPFDTKYSNSIVTTSQTNTSSQSIHTLLDYTVSSRFMSTSAGKKIYLDLGSEAKMKEGGLDIYRIVDPSPQNINSFNPTVVPTFTDYCFRKMYFQRGRNIYARVFLDVQNGGGAGGNRFWGNGGGGWDLSINEMTLSIRNLGVIPVDIVGRRLNPGASATFYGAELSDTSPTFEDAVLRLPGNFNFDYDGFKYRETRYEFTFKNIKLYNGDGGFLNGQANQEGPTHERTLFVTTPDAGPESSVPKYYLRSYLTNVNTFCSNGTTTAIVDGMAFVNPDQGGGRSDPFWGARFWSAPLYLDCYWGVPYRDDGNGEGAGTE